MPETLPSAKAPNNLPFDLEEQSKQRQQVFGALSESLKPWLFEFGNWIFGGLLAFNLVIVAPLITLGPNHTEILIAIALFVCALPLNVAGLVSLKLTADMNNIAIDEVVKQAFRDANVPQDNDTLETENEQLYKIRTDIGLRYSLRLAGLSIILTMTGMIAALWYIAWWVAAIFFLVSLIAFLFTMTVVTHLLRPAPQDAEALRQRYEEQRVQRKQTQQR